MTSVNSKFNILARSWKLKKTQIIWQNRKYKSMCQIQDVLVFYEHIQIGLNQSLRNLSCFSSKCKDLIRACSWRKKFWSMIGKALSHIKKNLSNAGHYQVRFVPRNSWGFDGGNSATPGKLCNFTFNEVCKKCFQHLTCTKLLQNDYWRLPSTYMLPEIQSSQSD